MKKIFFLVSLLVLFITNSFSQGYPITQYLGADSAVVVSKGGLQGRLINQVYADTNQANTQRIRQYPGAQIVTNGAGMKIWLRNNTATAWLQIPAGSGVGNIYTIDGTLSGNRTLSGGTNSLTFQGLSNFNVTTTDSVRLANSQQYFILSDTLAKLERAGKATILVNSLNGGARIVLNPTGPADEKKYEINAQNEEFWIAQISDSEALGDTIFFVNATGKVGIGTTSPTAKLDVRSNSNTTIKSVNDYTSDWAIDATAYGYNNGAGRFLQIDTVPAFNNYPVTLERRLPDSTNRINMGTGLLINMQKDDKTSSNVVALTTRIKDSTAAAFSADLAIRNRVNNVLATNLYISSAGNVGIQTTSPDSSLTVANGANFGRGVRMSGLPTAVGTKSLRVDASGTLSLADTLTNGVSGSLINGYLTKATGSNTIDTSQIYQTDGRVGIGTLTPKTRLMVAETA